MPASRRCASTWGLAHPPRTIEGFDIAHLGGSHVVAALVQFVGGVPNKDGYRRFRVRWQSTAMRIRAMTTTPPCARWSGAATCGSWPRALLALPDLVLIDGGAGQVRMAVEACREAGVSLTCLVGLAKREERIVRPDGTGTRAVTAGMRG